MDSESKFIRKIISEVINSIEFLHPNVKEEIPPILLTWDEYFNKVNRNSEVHPSSAYNYSYDEKNVFNCRKGAECRVIRHKKINKLDLKFFLVKD